MQEELNKRLLKWAGFEYLPHMMAWNLRQSDGLLDLHEHPPNFPESLDDCFEHLVPKAIALLRDRYISSALEAEYKLFDLWLTRIGRRYPYVGNEALDLCLVIEKLIKEV